MFFQFSPFSSEHLSSSSSGNYSFTFLIVEDYYRSTSHDNGFDHRDRPPWNRSEYDYRHGSIVASENARNSSNSEDPWSCVVVVTTFCVFVSMTLILGLYGTTNVWLGPNSSFLIKLTSVFIQNVIVEELGNKGSGMMLYGLTQALQLDVLANWSEVHYLVVPNDSYKYWIQYLNKGSRVKVSYNVESVGSSLYLVIAQVEGVDGHSEWVQDPTRPDTTLSYYLISVDFTFTGAIVPVRFSYQIASEGLKHRVFEVSLADLQGDEDNAHRKIRLSSIWW